MIPPSLPSNFIKTHYYNRVLKQVDIFADAKIIDNYSDCYNNTIEISSTLYACHNNNIFPQ